MESGEREKKGVGMMVVGLGLREWRGVMKVEQWVRGGGVDGVARRRRGGGTSQDIADSSVKGLSGPRR